MYIFFPVFLFFIILFALVFHFRSKPIIKKIRCQSMCEKVHLLNQLLVPFGFEYEPTQDAFTSRLDAWQRDYGYQYFYDISAPHFNMILDCEPVYFNYAGCTWLLEFWKGQYGINAGAEIGLYRSDRILSENEYETAHFHTVTNAEMPVFSLKLYDDISLLCSFHKKHWWLTGFVMGEYAEPENLYLKIQIDFPEFEMCCAFFDRLRALGYDQHNARQYGSSVTLYFEKPFSKQPRKSLKLTVSFARWKNLLFLKLYHRVTKPFTNTVDKLLYLYEFLPYAFRHMLILAARGKRKPASLKWRNFRKRG